MLTAATGRRKQAAPALDLRLGHTRNISEKTADSFVLWGCYRRGTRFNWKKRGFLRSLLVRHTYSVPTELAHERSYLIPIERGFPGLSSTGAEHLNFCASLLSIPALPPDAA